MKLLDTKIGQILTTDWVELFFDRISLNMYEKEQQKLRRQKDRLIERKKKVGLTEEERLCPIDSECDHDYIKNIEILGSEPFYNEKGTRGDIIYQRVTYIDDSIKDFNIYMTLSGLPIPEGYNCQKEKKKVNN